MDNVQRRSRRRRKPRAVEVEKAIPAAAAR
jgi:hypothetical protein